MAESVSFAAIVLVTFSSALGTAESKSSLSRGEEILESSLSLLGVSFKIASDFLSFVFVPEENKSSSRDVALGKFWEESLVINGSAVLGLFSSFVLPTEKGSSTSVLFVFSIEIENKSSESSLNSSLAVETFGFEETESEKSPPAKGSSETSFLTRVDSELVKPKNSSLISESLVSVLDGRCPESTSLFPSPSSGEGNPPQDTRALMDSSSFVDVPKSDTSEALLVAAAARRAWRVGGRRLTCTLARAWNIMQKK